MKFEQSRNTRQEVTDKAIIQLIEKLFWPSVCPCNCRILGVLHALLHETAPEPRLPLGTVCKLAGHDAVADLHPAGTRGEAMCRRGAVPTAFEITRRAALTRIGVAWNIHPYVGKNVKVLLCPSDAICFKGPVTTFIPKTLTITNINACPIAFRVKTTSPKVYCALPNSGIVEPSQKVSVIITRQAHQWINEPGQSRICDDMILIESAAIDSELTDLDLYDLWEIIHSSSIFHQKLQIVHLPSIDAEQEEESHFVECVACIVNPKGLGPSSPIQATERSASPLIPDSAVAPLVSLHPSDKLTFQRFRERAESHLIITNDDTEDIIFKITIKTSNPQKYTVRPSSGKIEAGNCLTVSVMYQTLEQERLSDVESTDKFRVQVMIVTPAMIAQVPLDDIVRGMSAARGDAAYKILTQKLAVEFTPVDGGATRLLPAIPGNSGESSVPPRRYGVPPPSEALFFQPP